MEQTIRNLLDNKKFKNCQDQEEEVDAGISDSDSAVGVLLVRVDTNKKSNGELVIKCALTYIFSIFIL